MSLDFELFGSTLAIESFPESSSDSYAIFKSGVYHKQNVPYIGTFTVLHTPVKGLPLSVECAESFIPSFDKIPYNILENLIEFYKHISTLMKSEVMCMVFYVPSSKEYKIVVPEQKVNGASVNYEYPVVPNDWIFILNTHSHNTFSAFFSGTDDKDEQRAMLYMVIGNLNLPEPKFALRAKVGNKSFPLLLEEVFEKKELENFQSLINHEEALSRIKKLEVRPLTSSNYYQSIKDSAPVNLPRKVPALHSSVFDNYLNQESYNNYDYDYAYDYVKTDNYPVRQKLSRKNTLMYSLEKIETILVEIADDIGIVFDKDTISEQDKLDLMKSFIGQLGHYEAFSYLIDVVNGEFDDESAL